MFLEYSISKHSRKMCDRCGVNRVNLRFWLRSPWTAHSEDDKKKPLTEYWRGNRYRGAYMQTIYVCKDCFVEIGNEIAAKWLAHINSSDLKTVKVHNIEEMKELAIIRHERAQVNKIVKARKHEVKQTQHKEKNNGLNVVGIL